MLDNVDDAIDVLGLVGKTVNAEAVARAVLGELAGAAAAAGGTSSTGWCVPCTCGCGCMVVCVCVCVCVHVL